MRQGLNLSFLNGFGSLMRALGVALMKFGPVYFLIFIAYGDKFLPSPLKQWSYNTRTTINSVLIGSVNLEGLRNTKYNNKRSDQIVDEYMNKK
ncbi:MAG: hypothetical protein NZ901_07395 [Geminocystis sp.]|nr:hypothetical protein [Geminocystis sp.]HIK36402.1 hypothetical protein [Geminocystis sp. M7585_C2015_104]MCS7147997.1 hypothetical protein [Geminocystis sp.]MCX8078972.1 hypothetical protein [Geminocystis sp.]MDW8116923.1 hypothetical protein [Geminocystis sp.]